MKHLISIEDITRQEVERLFALTKEMKASPNKFKNRLEGQTIGLIFEKPSTRTWVSFEAGVFSLGGDTIYLGPDDMKLGVREESRDVARVLNRYLSGLVMRTFEHKTIIDFERFFSKPVINGLSDFEHPCQALADFFTMNEYHKKPGTPRLAFIGDGNNVLNSLLLLTAKLGGHIRYATPKDHEPVSEIIRQAKFNAKKTGAQIEGFHDPREAVKDADFVYTDVWVSMGQEKVRAAKLKAFKEMQVNTELMKFAKKDAKVMHCLPAHRGEEITNEVIEGKNSIIFEQAENRLHVQKAVLLQLFG